MPGRVRSLLLSQVINLSLVVLTFIGTAPLRAQTAGPAEAVVRTGKMAQAPVIDGDLNDAGWKQVVEIGPFLQASRNSFARERTTAYIGYDAKNLYVAFHCVESSLDPVNQRIADFKPGTPARDDDELFKSDSVLLLLDSDDNVDTFFDLAVNAAGGVNDAACSGHNPWESRDKRWNFGGAVATRRFNGYWTAEISIPFSALKNEPVKGSSWRIGLGRLEQAQGETSSWQPIGTGLHNQQAFGRVVFDDATPGFRNADGGQFAFGENTMKFDIVSRPGQMNLRVETAFVFDGHGRDVSFRDFMAGETGPQTLDYTLQRQGGFIFRYRVLDPSTGIVYYRSPRYSADVSTSILAGRVQSGGDFVLSLNGREVARGGRGEKDIKFALVKGKNVLALETSAPVEASFSAGNFNFSTDRRWKYASTAVAGWKDAAFDDSAWKGAVAQGRALTAKGFYRKTLLLDHSEFWPNWAAKELTVAENSSQLIFLLPRGLEGRELKDYHLWLDMPSEFRLVGATGSYGRASKPAKPSFKAEAVGAVKHGDAGYRRYRIRAVNPVKYQQNYGEHEMCAMAIELPVSARKFDERNMLFYYGIEAEGGAVQEVTRPLKVKVLPPLRGKQPKTYDWQIAAGSISVFDDDAVRQSLLAGMARAGFNTVWYDDFEGSVAEIKKATNGSMKHLGMIAFNPWTIDVKPYLAKHPEHAMINRDGKRLYEPQGRSYIAPSLLIRDTPAWNFVEKAIIRWVRRHKVDNACWDFEYSPWGDNEPHTQITDFGPSALADFREFAKLPADTKLDYKILRAEYKKPWEEFLCRRYAVLAGRFRAAVHKGNPKSIFTVYSGYHSEETRELYGIDWALLADKVDVASAGYGRNAKELNDTLRVLGKTRLVTGDIIYPYYYNLRTYPTAPSRATLLRRAVDGTGGIMLWQAINSDGRAYRASAEISRLVADYEPLFVTHRNDLARVALQGIESENATLYSDGKRDLLLLINETDQPKEVTVRHQHWGAAMKVLDYFNEQTRDRQTEIVCTLRPNDVKAFVIEKAQ